MRIGLISDIHGDIDGLIKALHWLDNTQADAILCAGDLIEHKSTDSEAVIALIRERQIPCVQGNHDKSAEMLLKWVRERNGDLDSLPPHRRLSYEALEYLAALPLIQQFDYSGRQIAVAHGTPWSPYTSLFPSESTEMFARAVNMAKADVLILGHTHAPMAVEYGQTWIINPGAVWQNHPMHQRYGERTCAILDLNQDALHFIDIDTGITMPSVLN